MRGKGLLAAGAALLGLEAFNRRVQGTYAEIDPQLPGDEPEMWQWRFGRVAVYKSGQDSNPPILMLHGHNAAASAAEMTQPFNRLSDEYCVYAPDLLGYGLSDRPDIEYEPQLFIELIEDILREVVQRPAIVMASSVTAAHAIEAAAGNPEWIERLVLICPTGVRNLTSAPAAEGVVQRILGLPVVGRAIFNGVASRSSIRYFLKRQAYYNPELVTDELVDRYYRTAHAPGARYAPSAFVAGRLYWDAGEAWTRLEQRALLVWGREAAITPTSDAAAYLATNPGAEMEEIAQAGILPHDEQPEQFENVVRAWLRR
jgi:pimeloyl-ACP methyl ester carboxylesterase